MFAERILFEIASFQCIMCLPLASRRIQKHGRDRSAGPSPIPSLAIELAVMGWAKTCRPSASCLLGPMDLDLYLAALQRNFERSQERRHDFIGGGGSGS
jgi:hypothetical protein